jgi:hypothetical protein
MRASIPGYNRLVAPMQRCMEAVNQYAGGRTKTMVARVQLDEEVWKPEQLASFQESKAALKQAVELAHPDLAKKLCVFADASEGFGAR